MDILGDEDFNFFYSSADMERLIFGVCDASRILDYESASDISGKQAVLVFPADNEEAARNVLQKARGAGKAGEAFQEWLAENHLLDWF